MIIGSSAIGGSPGVGESYVVRSKTYGMDAYVVGVSGTYGMEFSIIKTPLKTFTTDALILKACYKYLSVKSVFMASPETSYAASVIMIPMIEDRLPTDSIISTLICSWAAEFNTSYQRIAESAKTINLSYADTTDLDIIGGVYHLYRRVNESDDSYRKRLRVQTNVILSFGTKAACEAIIDNANGISGCEILTGIPGTVRVTFDNDVAMRAAYTNRSALEVVLGDSLLAGITWALYTPIKDYTINMALLGMDECPYTMSTMNQERDHFSDYLMSILNVLLREKQLTNVDFHAKKRINYQLPSYTSIMKIGESDILVDSFIMKTMHLFPTFDINILLKDILKSISTNLFILNDHAFLEYDIDAFYAKRRLSAFNQYIYVVKRNSASYAMDILIQNLIAEYTSDIHCKKQIDRTYRSRVTMAV